MTGLEAEPPATARRVSGWWAVGITIVPIVFVWPLLRSGHSTLARVLGFGWLFAGLLTLNTLISGQDAAQVQRNAGTAAQASTASGTTGDARRAEADARRRVREDAKRARETAYARTKAMIAAEQLVRESLRDPGSARFSGTAFYASAGADVVCGQVNARNGFGGMSGPRGYIVVGQLVILEEADAKFYSEARRGNCAGTPAQTL